MVDAEAYLAALEPIGWRFGLERIRRLVSVLGMPQHRFATIHVVGTNGKSSVTRMAAALLEAHGVTAGAYLSPHVERWSERIVIRGGEIGARELADALARTAEAAAVVDRALERSGERGPRGEPERVTQFEALTAAAFVALAAARVEVGVIEAGLGGRLDATNVLPSRVAVLTSVGLEHTQWLGGTEVEVAAEKLAVLRDHSTLVLGRVSEEVAELARRMVDAHGARLVVAGELPPDAQLAAPGAYQRRNLGVASAAVESLLGGIDPERVRAVAARLELPGRVELLGGDPPVVLDAAHNPEGARALAEALPEAVDGRRVIACIAVLADKDAAGMLAELAPRLHAAVFTEVPPERLAGAGRPGAHCLEAGKLAELGREAGLGGVEAIRDPDAALRRAQELARAHTGVMLVSGSQYLLGYARRGAVDG